MNPTPAPPDPELRTLLRSAHPAPALPPGFEDGVWRRIERGAGAAPNPAEWLGQLVARLFHPAWALSGLAAVTLFGLGLGWHSADARSLAAERNRYLAAVSPLHRTP